MPVEFQGIRPISFGLPQGNLYSSHIFDLTNRTTTKIAKIVFTYVPPAIRWFMDGMIFLVTIKSALLAKLDAASMVVEFENSCRRAKQ